MKNKFEIKDNRTFGQKIKALLQSLIFWKGRKKGIVYTRDINWEDIRAIFFPKNFYEKYCYLGSIPYNEDGDLFKALYPLVLAADYQAKPEYCPRWFLRFLHVFGNDKSIVRIRNRFYSNLFGKLTKGIVFWDYKTKWAYYDLRISITGPKHLQDLASDIERGFYSRGRQEELVADIKKLDPTASIVWGSVDRLVEQYNNLLEKKEKDESNSKI
jgi:hypothetical protein